MKQQVGIVMVMGLLCAFAAGSSDLKLAQVESALVAERENIEANSTFIPAVLLDELYRLKPSELSLVASRSGVDEELLRDGLQKIESMGRYRQELADEGLLQESGCMNAPRRGWEVNLLATPTGARLSFSEVLEKAYGAFLVEVTEVRSGYYKGLGSRVAARVQEVLGETPIRLEPGDRLEYFQGYFSIQVGEIDLCAERLGFEREEVGDRILLLAAAPTSYQGPDTLVASLTIPVVGHKVILPPYRALIPEEAMELETLRVLLGSLGNRVE